MRTRRRRPALPAAAQPRLPQRGGRGPLPARSAADAAGHEHGLRPARQCGRLGPAHHLQPDRRPDQQQSGRRGDRRLRPSSRTWSTASATRCCSIRSTGSTPNCASSDLSLIEAFLNPLAVNEGGALTPEQAAGAIVRGTPARSATRSTSSRPRCCATTCWACRSTSPPSTWRAVATPGFRRSTRRGANSTR